jgi:hypothetical protein
MGGVVMSVFTALRGVGATACAISLWLVMASGAFAASPVFLCVGEMAGSPVTSGGATGSCKTNETPVALPSEKAQQETLLSILAHAKYEEKGVGGKPTVQFSGVNVQVVNGEGHTYTANGEGNLVIGYNEQGGGPGSHNLILGNVQGYTSYADVLVGSGDLATAPFSLVTGGENAAEGYYTAVTGGTNNTARGNYATVTGGWRNSAIGKWASVSGGESNYAYGEWASVSGGEKNKASGKFSSISGGGVNEVASSGEWASVSGGESNTASGKFSSISAGIHNTANAEWASVGGGEFNTASGLVSWIGGGDANTASGKVSSVSGGEGNKASGEYSSILGGGENTASGVKSAVSGGNKNTAKGNYSSILGGKLQEAQTEFECIPKC